VVYLTLTAEINQDPKVMEHFPTIKSLKETKAFISGSKALFKEIGYCFYAAELKDSHEFIGFVGIAPVYEMPCTPAIEIAWRLGTKFGGKGYATEAAQAVIDYAFNTLDIKELVSVTATTNKKSERVMQRLGFTRSEQDDFDHPRITDGHPLRRHIFYRLKNQSCKIFDTQRLYLRDFQESDFMSVHEYGIIPDFSQYEQWGPNTEPHSLNFIREAIKKASSTPRHDYELAVILKDTGQLIGSGHIARETQDSRVGSIGYAINPKFQNQGFATEVAKGLIEFGFKNLNLCVIYATCDTKNIA
jgi:RimJ/RimL family protein N-acetyltransferase